MKPIILSLFVAVSGPAFGALAELNRDTGTIATADGTFTGRNYAVPPDFKLELLFRGTAEQGSWVPTAWDAQGRLLVASNSRELMFRLTIPKVGEPGEVTVEPIDVPMGGAHGLVRAFDAVYVNVDQGRSMPNGVYRIVDSDKDGKYDKSESIRNLPGRGDHGLQNLKLGPDGRIYMSAGFASAVTYDSSVAPEAWGEDNLVRRTIPGTGLAGPGQFGWISRFGADAKDINLFATGFRNAVGIAFNQDNELFVWDSDTEFDMGTPWYRPNYVSHVISGMDSGWRSDSRMHPQYTLEYFGPMANIGSGSPVGVIAGTGLKFPARFQDSLFLTDWSYGMLHTVSMVASGATYKGEPALFARGSPFPIVEPTVNRADGSLLVLTGGTASSNLFRITYTGAESTAATAPDRQFSAQRELRRRIESFHGRKDPAAVTLAWQYLGDADNALRHAARVALEWQDPAAWRERALATERDPRKVIAAIAALARVSAKDAFLRPPEAPAPDAALAARMIVALDRINWTSLGYQDQLDLLRAYELTLIRLGPPDAATRQRLLAKFDPLLPASNQELNWALAEMLVYLEAPSAPAKLMALLRSAPSAPYFPAKEYIAPILRAPTRPAGLAAADLAKQVNQIQYAMLVRQHKTGWTPALRAEYVKWFLTAAETFEGGNRFPGALESIRADAYGALPAETVEALKETLAIQPTYKSAPVPRGRGAPASAQPAAGRGPARGQEMLMPLPPGP